MREIINTFPEKIKDDIERATEILKKYGCSEVFIFGSLVKERFNENSDIDIAVRGLKDEDYFKVLAELGREICCEVDLIDLDDEENRFAQFILSKKELVKVVWRINWRNRISNKSNR